MPEKATYSAYEAATSPGTIVESSKKKKLSRPVVHMLGRIEQILACADRLMDRAEPPERD